MILRVWLFRDFFSLEDGLRVSFNGVSCPRMSLADAQRLEGDAMNLHADFCRRTRL